MNALFRLVLPAFVALIGAIGLVLWAHRANGQGGVPFWVAFFAFWIVVWVVNHRLSLLHVNDPAWQRVRALAVPAVFGISLLILWEAVCIGGGVPMVLMPAPSKIGAKFLSELPTLGVDFRQTVLKAVIPGWALGSALGIGVAMLCDRFAFLRRGLLPIGNFVSALPIIGIAPIMVYFYR